MQSNLPVSFIIACFMLLSCNSNTSPGNGETSAPGAVVKSAGQSAVQDDVSQKNVVQVAVGSADHTTLVKAVQAAELVDALSNTGPFTVFAPTNAAFDKLPAGTVEDLLTAAKKDDLANILQYHVSLGVFKTANLSDKQVIGQVNGDDIVLTLMEGKWMVNGTASIVASIPASNGIIHVIDGVLLPAEKK